MSEQEDNAGIVMHPPVFYITATLIGLGIDYLYPLSFGYATILEPIAIVLLITGILIAFLGIRTFKVNEQDFNVHTPSEKILSTGVFKLSRNPLYLSLLMAMLSVSFYFDKVWILVMVALLVPFINKVVIAKEEAYLTRKFGQEYLDYKKKSKTLDLNL